MFGKDSQTASETLSQKASEMASETVSETVFVVASANLPTLDPKPIQERAPQNPNSRHDIQATS